MKKLFLLLLTTLSFQAFAVEGQRDEFLTKVYEKNSSNNPYDYFDYVYEPFVYKKAIHRNDPEADDVKDFYKSCDFIGNNEETYNSMYQSQDMAKIGFMCSAFNLKVASDIRDRVDNEYFLVSESSKYEVSLRELQIIQNRYDESLSLAASVRSRKNSAISLASYFFISDPDFIVQLNRLFY